MKGAIERCLDHSAISGAQAGDLAPLLITLERLAATKVIRMRAITNRTAATGPSPLDRPPTLTGFTHPIRDGSAERSGNDIRPPEGKTLLRRKRQAPEALRIRRIDRPVRNRDGRAGSWLAVRSPAAVPTANVNDTAPNAPISNRIRQPATPNRLR